ncbi:Uncharacterised protein [Mycobacteroides abscessus subsp. abscessus]|nr:Uncharacterised protein [Mycobacteroides abscessus subsp. abscessus]
MSCSDMNRRPGSGMEMLTGPASRSNTAEEYNVSRFCRITSWRSSGDSSRM